jgi:phage terminase small subunit
LSAATRRWFEDIVENYEIMPNHVKFLISAAHYWDVFLDAWADIKKHGYEYLDRFEAPRQRPAVNVMNHAHARFVSAMRSLGLDLSEPSDDE